MNPSTLIGMFAGLVFLFVVVALSAEEPGAFLNLPGLAIVIGGTFAATFISYPLREVLRIFRVFGIVLRNERMYTRADIEELIEFSRLWYRGNLTAVENKLESVRNPFLRAGVQLVIDRAPLPDIMDFLHWRIARMKARERAEAQVFRTMASFAPAFGMIGTLVGLINMMFVLENGNLAVIGQHMAVALTTTFYGILLANLVFRPVAVKMERRTEQRVVLMNMIVEGIGLMAQARNPSFVRETLNAFMKHYEDDIRDRSIPRLAREERLASPLSGQAGESADVR